MALGVVGLSFGDFCRLTFGEFEAVMKAHNEAETIRQQGEWERMRLHAAMTMQPHCKRKLDPRKLLPFEWEKKGPDVTKSAVLSKDEAKEAFMRRIGKKGNAER
ncbi:MAG: hypothetical protein K2L11_09390 [Muribaculaceae bacterium]|nr:hypothetical protein [Muribaculaceae bacterium]